MKILHLIGGGDVGGAKFHVLTLVRELGKYIDVKLVALRPGPFAEDARAMGIDVEVVNTGNIFRDIKKITAIIKKDGYEAIHCHGAKANMLGAITRRFVNIPTVTTVHSDYRLDYLQSLPKRLSFGVINTIALRFINYYVAVSNNFKNMLVKRGFKAERIFTVYNGIDFSKEPTPYSREEFAKKYGLDIKSDDILVGILGRFDPVKGMDTFIRAAKIVVSRSPSVKFILGGEGKQRKELENLASSLGISSNVLFPGWINNAHEFMNCLDINVLTSLSESFPYVILEGVLYKRATVSSNVGGISDLIESGKNGYLFEPGDYKKLAEYLTELVNNDSLRREMGERIYRKASAEFSLDNICKTHLDIYKNILGR